MSNSKYLAGGILAVVVIAAAVYLSTRNGSAPKPMDQGSVRGNTVVFTEQGFSPSSLSVKMGDTVTFKNESSVDMWVASAPHPAHTDYSEFDAKKVYKPGESFSFTFNKTGNWKYHNHRDPTKFGSVNVQ